MMLVLRWGKAAGILALGTLGCTELSVVQEGMCGNGVVEKGEDCDQKDGTSEGDACGQPDTSGECRYICKHLGGLSCPEGFRCGNDDICRKPVDPMTWTQVSIPEGRCEELLVTDFDGDGINDVIAVAPPTVTVHYFEKSRASTQGDTLVIQSPHASVGSLTQPTETMDGGTSSSSTASPTLAVNLSRGLSLFTGQSDRTLAPSAYASVSLDKANYRVAPFLYEDGLSLGVPLTGLFAYTATGLVAMTPPDDPIPLAAFPGAETLAGDGVVARFDGGKCDGIALPFNDQSRGHVLVYSPCAVLEKPPTAVTPIDVALPPSVKLCVDSGMDMPPPNQRCHPLHVVDINSDGRPDLVAVDDKYQLHLAFGHDDGTFGATPALTNNAFSLAYPMSNAIKSPPIAVGDLNGDCALDVVDDQSIWLSYGLLQGDCAADGVRSTGVYVDFAKTEDPHSWTEAKIADMNKDGIPDVVVASSQSSGITLYAGTGMTLFNPFRIVTSAPIKELTVGDFDGDMVNDLAFVELGQVDPETNLPYDTVLMSFGAIVGAPTEPVAIADIRGVSQLLPTYEQRIYPDLIRDLYVVSASGAEGMMSTNLYVFPGDTGRQIDAPYYLVQPLAKSNIDVPTRSVIGSFSGDKNYRDIAVFARPIEAACPTPESCVSRLWLLPTGKSASIEPATSDAPNAPKVTTLPTSLSGARDVLLGNLGPQVKGGHDVLVLAGQEKAGATLLVTATVADGALAMASSASLEGIGIMDDANRVEAKLITADVNHDEHLDVILVSPTGGIAVVLWDEGKNALDVSVPKRVTMEELEKLGCGMTSINAPANMRPSLAATVLVSPSGEATILAVEPDAAYAIAYRNSELEASCRLDLAGGYAIATADFDGDGIEDVIISESNGLDVYYGNSVPAGGFADVDTTSGDAQ
ncbi:Hypothetical protein A7982_03056 [Minicystis rosea]|nr:Hypothetical protein A7982_03056 [Minicystis rosea]